MPNANPTCTAAKSHSVFRLQLKTDNANVTPKYINKHARRKTHHWQPTLPKHAPIRGQTLMDLNRCPTARLPLLDVVHLCVGKVLAHACDTKGKATKRRADLNQLSWNISTHPECDIGAGCIRSESGGGGWVGTRNIMETDGNTAAYAYTVVLCPAEFGFRN